uniref:CREB/ATF bZIP transcription factor n=1 Tax=Iconisemion striatum TaxID=60296 RepID=A0A1A7YDP6_9TELE
MITRRRSRIMNTTEVLSEDVEVVDAVETVEDLPRASEGLHIDDTDPAGIELDDLLEDFKWTLEKEDSSSLFDIDLSDLGDYNIRDQNSGFDVSAASSPERTSSESRMKNRHNQSSQINKNAIAARLNRLKKKEYVGSLEKQVDILSAENTGLKQENSQLTKRVEELEDETRGLTQMTTIMRCPGSGRKWRRNRHLAACVCT